MIMNIPRLCHMFIYFRTYVFLYLSNYITSLYWKLSEHYKHGCRNDQPICKNKGRNESNELNSNNLRFFQNSLGLLFHTTYSCNFHSRIFSRPVKVQHCISRTSWKRQLYTDDDRPSSRGNFLEFIHLIVPSTILSWKIYWSSKKEPLSTWAVRFKRNH